MQRNACSGTTRLSKGSLLSMMGDGPFRPAPMTDPPLADERRDKILSVIDSNGGDLNRSSVVLGIAASSLRRRMVLWGLSRPAVREESTNPTRRFFERTKSPWGVRSFDPRTGQVCIEIRNPSTTTNFAYKAPSFRIPD